MAIKPWQPLGYLDEVDHRHDQLKETTMTREQMIAALLAKGYTIDGVKLPAHEGEKWPGQYDGRPQSRQTQALDGYEYDYQRDREAPNAWIPAAALRQRNGAGWKALRDRRVAWQTVCPDASPQEVVDACCSLMLVDIMNREATSRGRRLDDLMSPNTEL